jgi:hypothetical protein
MADAALFRRTTAATGLVGSAVLAAAATLVYRPTGGGVPADVLTSLQRAPGPAEISAVLFVLQGFAAVIAALAIGHLLRGRFPLLSSVGVTLGALGGFAEAVATTFTLAFVPMARDTAHYGTYLGVIAQADRVQNLFSLVGLLGTVIGTLLLSIGIFRAQVGPRWVGPAIWAFLVLEFVGSGFGPAFGLAAVTLGVIAYTALGVTVWTSPRTAWMTAAEASVPDPVPTLA